MLWQEISSKSFKTIFKRVQISCLVEQRLIQPRKDSLNLIFNGWRTWIGKWTKSLESKPARLICGCSYSVQYTIIKAVDRTPEDRMRWVKDSFDEETLTLLITSLVFSKMLNCSSVWSNTSAENIKRCQSIQNFASRIVTNCRKYDHVTPLLQHWLSVKQLLHHRDSVLTYKCMNELDSEYLSKEFIKHSNVHTRDTRTCDAGSQHARCDWSI